MTNAELKLDGNILTIIVDMTKSYGSSKSGKSTIIATSGGNKSIPGVDAKIGLNIYQPR